jgi:hypothetical protein
MMMMIMCAGHRVFAFVKFLVPSFNRLPSFLDQPIIPYTMSAAQLAEELRAKRVQREKERKEHEEREEREEAELLERMRWVEEQEA